MYRAVFSGEELLEYMERFNLADISAAICYI